MFTKQHYEAIAKILKTARASDIDEDSSAIDAYDLAILTIENDLVDLFQADNPLFKPSTFVRASA